MLNALDDLGYQTQGGPVHLTFSHPHLFNTTGDYNIGFVPWESTDPKDPEWIKYMERMDEIWVPSMWLQNVVDYWGFDSHLYEHGINHSFQFRYRPVEDKVRFLFMGLEAYRKGGLDAIRAFRAAFPNQDDVELVIKTQDPTLGSPFNNITFAKGNWPVEDLIRLYWDCHAFVAPSYGEGFGIPALEAAATGMPVIATKGFLPYEDFLLEELLVESEMIASPWPETHPGLMFQPDFDSLVEAYRAVYENYNNYSRMASRNSPLIHQHYDWKKLTNQSFSALANRLC